MAIAGHPAPGPGPQRRSSAGRLRVELAEGFRWLWAHDLLRTLAITLGVLNLLGNISGAVVVLYGQEVLGTSVVEFADLLHGAAPSAAWSAAGRRRRDRSASAPVGRWR